MIYFWWKIWWTPPPGDLYLFNLTSTGTEYAHGILTTFLHSGYKAGQRDLWGQLHHGRRRRRSHGHWSGNTPPEGPEEQAEQADRCGKRDVTEQEKNRVDHGRVKAKTLQGEFAEKQRDILIFFQCRFVSHFPRTTCRDILWPTR